MTLRIVDPIEVANLPAGMDAYAGYIDGQWANFDGLVSRFPNALHLSILRVV